MITQEVASVVQQLKSEREQLKLLNRTVFHTMNIASRRELLSGNSNGQHMRRVPSAWGCRRDAFTWDSLDWSVRGEDDLHRFFEIARRLGAGLGCLKSTDAASLLPGSLSDVVGSRTHLYLPDYWLFVVHHLCWTAQLPYACPRRWKPGSSFEDNPFSMSSRLRANVVQASIDALTVLIDAASQGIVELAADHLRQPNSIPPTSAVLSDRAIAVRRKKKRAERAANIELLRAELVAHIRAARDHAKSAADFGREPELLPRPSRKELAERAGISETAASRCFGDPNASELNLLWETAGDLDSVMSFARK